MTTSIDRSRALWNRSAMDWTSREVLAQILDRGSMEDWREVYRRAKSDPALRARIEDVVRTVPLPLPRFWLAALASLGAEIDLGAPVPDYYEGTSV